MQTHTYTHRTQKIEKRQIKDKSQFLIQTKLIHYIFFVLMASELGCSLLGASEIQWLNANYSAVRTGNQVAE